MTTVTQQRYVGIAIAAGTGNFAFDRVTGSDREEVTKKLETVGKTESMQDYNLGVPVWLYIVDTEEDTRMTRLDVSFMDGNHYANARNDEACASGADAGQLREPVEHADH